jgi:cytochrome c5
MAAPDLPTHEPPIRTPKQLVVVLALAFIVPVIVILLLVTLVTSGIRTDTGQDALASDAVAARIKPVADIAIGEAETAQKGESSGEQVFKTVCAACHETGAAGAPKVGDKAAWGKLIAQGQKQLLASAIKGIRAMPPRGGNPDLTDVELDRAIVFMANRSGANFKEPPAPKAAAAKGAEKGADKSAAR